MRKKKVCKVCKRAKKIAYGQRYDKGKWCYGCDCAYEPDINKKRARQKNKKEITKELNDIID